MKEINPKELDGNVFEMLSEQWMLITAGDISNYNTMTASWGGFGVVWGKNVCWCVVRPTRHTHSFMEKNEYFTLSFFPEEYREALKFCGKESGRDYDKAKETGLIAIEGGISGTTSFEQANLIITCRKNYFHDFDPKKFIDQTIDSSCYPQKDYHRMYFGEIISVKVK